jgi:hypothetical protein
LEQNQILRHQKELKSLEKKSQENELKELKVQKQRQMYQIKIEKQKNLLLEKLDKNEERIKKQKLEQEKKVLKKNNLLFMQREDRKIKIEQNERAKNFERELLLSQIQERMEKLQDIKKEKHQIEEKRKQIEKELVDEKEGMENRLQKIMKYDEYLTRDEILDYVFNDIKPNTKNKSKLSVSRRNKEFEEKNISNNNSKDYISDKFENINEKKTDFNNSQELHHNFDKKVDNINEKIHKDKINKNKENNNNFGNKENNNEKVNTESEYEEEYEYEKIE